jgi:hypothetical protein
MQAELMRLRPSGFFCGVTNHEAKKSVLAAQTVIDN